MKMEDKFGDEPMEETAHSGSKDKERKMMTMADVSECLHKDFAEEMSDAKKYLCMAKIADHAGDEHDCHYLLEMAKDEWTHAMFIHDFMKRHELHIPEEHEECYCKLEKEMAEFF